MLILYQTKWLKHMCTDRTAACRRWGTACANKLAQRLDELEAACALGDIRHLPGPRCHELTGDMTGMLAVSLGGAFRLIFEPADEVLPRKADGGLDWDRVTAIRLLKVVDHH